MKILLTALLLVSTGQATELHKRGGTDIGGGNGGEFLDGSWYQKYQKQRGLLQMYSRRAHIRLNMTGSHFAANKILLLGLRDSLEYVSKHQEEGTSFTRRALERGLELMNWLGMVGNDYPEERRDRQHNHILEWYYFFMDEHIVRMDPSIELLRTRGIDVPEETVQKIERRFVAYAKAQLHWVNDVLAAEVFDYLGNERRVVPKGHSDSYLIAARWVAEHAAEDLRHSLWKYRFECAARELDNLKAQLIDYNLGSNSMIFPTEAYAVAYSYKKIRNTINELNNSGTCPAY